MFLPIGFYTGYMKIRGVHKYIKLKDSSTVVYELSLELKENRVIQHWAIFFSKIIRMYLETITEKWKLFSPDKSTGQAK